MRAIDDTSNEVPSSRKTTLRRLRNVSVARLHRVTLLGNQNRPQNPRQSELAR